MKSILLLLSVILLIYCGNTNSQIIDNVDSIQFQNLIQKSDGLIIDVRTSKEFDSGHLVEATNIDFYSDNFEEKLKIVSKDIPIYVYCKSGGRSAIAASIMEKLGFNKVYNLLGGIEAWHGTLTDSSHAINYSDSTLITFTNLEISTFLSNNENVLVYYSTKWCVPCRKMKPIIEQIENEFLNIKVVYIDADINKHLLEMYQVKSVPTTILYKNTTELFRYEGLIHYDNLSKKLLD